MLNIDEMQFGFVPGRHTTDAIFIVRQLQEKYIAAKKLLYIASVDLEKAFDHVPRKVIWWVLRSLGVKEWAVWVIQGMYSKAVVVCGSMVSTVRSLVWELVCIRALSLAHCSSFMLEALSREFRTAEPWELLYADDLVLIADTKEEYISKLKAWKAGMESKGLHVKMKNSKFLVSGDYQDVLQISGKYPCPVCCSGVGRNTCSGITKRLVEDPN